MKCPYCGDEIPEGESDPEKCPEKPFTVVLTRKEIWGLIDGYFLTEKEVKQKLARLIGRDK